MRTTARNLTQFFGGRRSRKRSVLLDMIFAMLKYEINPWISSIFGDALYICRILRLKDALASSQYFLRAEGSKPNADCTARATFCDTRVLLPAPTPRKHWLSGCTPVHSFFDSGRDVGAYPRDLWWNKKMLLSLSRRLSRTLGEKWALRATTIQQLHSDATNQIFPSMISASIANIWSAFTSNRKHSTAG